jgi:hypothetical protein
MCKLVGLLLLLSLAGCVRHFSGAETVSDSVDEFLKKHSTEQADAKWKKEFVARLDGMLKDNDALSGQNAAADIVVYNWFADRLKKFKANGLAPEEKVEVCRMYALYTEKGWCWPFSKHLTLENYRRWIAGPSEITVAEKTP